MNNLIPALSGGRASDMTQNSSSLIEKYRLCQENRDNLMYNENIHYLEELDRLGQLDEDNLRLCSHCNTPMIGGYYLDGEFACSDECAVNLYSGDEKLFRENLSHAEEESCETYWTQWDTVFFDNNQINGL